MTTKEIKEVITAYEDGKPIECINKCSKDSVWKLDETPDWDFYMFDYRVKPEPPKPEYVPYETGAEFMQEVLKHKGWVRTTEEDEYERCYYPIGAFSTCDKGCDVISSNPPEDWHTPFGTLLAGYVWADDGTPCGKLKGGTV